MYFYISCPKTIVFDPVSGLYSCIDKHWQQLWHIDNLWKDFEISDGTAKYVGRTLSVDILLKKSTLVSNLDTMYYFLEMYEILYKTFGSTNIKIET